MHSLYIVRLCSISYISASTPSPLVKTKVKSAAKKASSSKPAPSSMDISPVAPPPVATVPPPPQSPIKLIHGKSCFLATDEMLAK